MEKIPSKACVECKLKDGSVNFIAEVQADSIAMLMSRIATNILLGLRQSFGADEWDRIEIMIERKEENNGTV